MRRIFASLPYFLPAEPEVLRKFFEEKGISRYVKKGQSLKFGGEEARLFYLQEGLCAYYAGEGLSARPCILSFILPHRMMGDLTAIVDNRCNVHTVALENSRVLVLPPTLLQQAVTQGRLDFSLVMKNVIAKQEALLEGMTANISRPPAERLAVLIQSYLVLENVRPDSHGWFRFPVRLSAERMGEALCLSRVCVARILGKWKTLGFCTREDGFLWFSAKLFANLDDWMRSERN